MENLSLIGVKEYMYFAIKDLDPGFFTPNTLCLAQMREAWVAMWGGLNLRALHKKFNFISLRTRLGASTPCQELWWAL